MHLKANFIPRNDGFICDHCHATVPPAKSTFRNHCPQCLTSKHVDAQTPGDRAATCGGLMPTVAFEGTDPDQLAVVQRCQCCDHTRRNRLAPDDQWRAAYSPLL